MEDGRVGGHPLATQIEGLMIQDDRATAHVTAEGLKMRFRDALILHRGANGRQLVARCVRAEPV